MVATSAKTPVGRQLDNGTVSMVLILRRTDGGCCWKRSSMRLYEGAREDKW